MGLAYIEGAGGGGVRSSDVTANAGDILVGKYDLTAQSDDEVVQGSMPNNGTVNHSLPINGSFTIAQGYHSGSGKVTQSITTKGAATYYAGTSDQTISSGRYLSGTQTIKKLTQTNLTGANIKPGVTVKINNGNTDVFSVEGTMAAKNAATYYAGTSDQTIASGQYLTGTQTIKKLTQSNLSAGNVRRGVTVKVNNGNADVFSVTGTYFGSRAEISAVAYRDPDLLPTEFVVSDEQSFTMPSDGVVCYGGISYFYRGMGEGTCEIYKNGTLMDSRNYAGYIIASMVNKSFNANRGDVIKVKATTPTGTHAVVCMIQAVCVY